MSENNISKLKIIGAQPPMLAQGNDGKALASINAFYGPWSKQDLGVDVINSDKLLEVFNERIKQNDINLEEIPLGLTIATYESEGKESGIEVKNIQEWWWTGNAGWQIKQTKGSGSGGSESSTIANYWITAQPYDIQIPSDSQGYVTVDALKKASKTTVMLHLGSEDVDLRNFTITPIILTDSLKDIYEVKVDPSSTKDSFTYHLEFKDTYLNDDNNKKTPNNGYSERILLNEANIVIDVNIQNTYNGLIGQNITANKSGYAYSIDPSGGFCIPEVGGVQFAFDVDIFDLEYEENIPFPDNFQVECSWVNGRGELQGDFILEQKNDSGHNYIINNSTKLKTPIGNEVTLSEKLGEMQTGEFIIIKVSDGKIKQQQTVNIQKQSDLQNFILSTYALTMTRTSIEIPSSLKKSTAPAAKELTTRMTSGAYFGNSIDCWIESMTGYDGKATVHYLNKEGIEFSKSEENSALATSQVYGFYLDNIQSDLNLQITLKCNRYSIDTDTQTPYITRKLIMPVNVSSSSVSYTLDVIPNILGLTNGTIEEGSVYFTIFKYDDEGVHQLNTNDVKSDNITIKFDDRDEVIAGTIGQTAKLSYDFTQGDQIYDSNKTFNLYVDGKYRASDSISFYDIPKADFWSISTNNDYVFLDDNIASPPDLGDFVDIKLSVNPVYNGNVQYYINKKSVDDETPFSITTDTKNPDEEGWAKSNSNVFTFKYKEDLSKYLVGSKLKIAIYTIPYKAVLEDGTEIKFYQKIQVLDITDGKSFKLLVSPQIIHVTSDYKYIDGTTTDIILDLEVVEGTGSDVQNVPSPIIQHGWCNPKDHIKYSGSDILVSYFLELPYFNEVSTLSSTTYKDLDSKCYVYRSGSQYFIRQNKLKEVFAKGDPIFRFWYKSNKHGWVKVDSESISHVKDGKDGSNIQLDNDAVVIDDSSTDSVLKILTEVTPTFIGQKENQTITWNVELSTDLDSYLEVKSDTSGKYYLKRKSSYGNKALPAISGYVTFSTTIGETTHSKRQSIQILDISDGEGYNLVVQPNTIQVSNTGQTSPEQAYVQLTKISDNGDETIYPSSNNSIIKFYITQPEDKSSRNNQLTSIELSTDNLYKKYPNGFTVIAEKKSVKKKLSITRNLLIQGNTYKTTFTPYLQDSYLIARRSYNNTICLIDNTNGQITSQNQGSVWNYTYGTLINILIEDNIKFAYNYNQDGQSYLKFDTISNINSNSRTIHTIPENEVCNTIILDAETVGYAKQGNDGASSVSGISIFQKNGSLKMGTSLEKKDIESGSKNVIEIKYNGTTIPQKSGNTNNWTLEISSLQYTGKPNPFTAIAENDYVYLTLNEEYQNAKKYPPGTGILDIQVKAAKTDDSIGFTAGTVVASITWSFITMEELGNTSFQLILDQDVWNIDENKNINNITLDPQITIYQPGQNKTIKYSEIATYNDQHPDAKLRVSFSGLSLNGDYIKGTQQEVQKVEGITNFYTLNTPQAITLKKDWFSGARQIKIRLDVIVDGAYVLRDIETFDVIRNGTPGTNGGTFRFMGAWNELTIGTQLYSGKNEYLNTGIYYIDIVTNNDADGVTHYYQCIDDVAKQIPEGNANNSYNFQTGYPETDSKKFIQYFTEYTQYEQLISHTIFVKDSQGNITGGFTGGKQDNPNQIVIWSGQPTSSGATLDQSAFKVTAGGEVYASNFIGKGFFKEGITNITSENWKNYLIPLKGYGTSNSSQETFEVDNIKTSLITNSTDISRNTDIVKDDNVIKVNEIGNNIYLLRINKITSQIRLREDFLSKNEFDNKINIILIPFITPIKSALQYQYLIPKDCTYNDIVQKSDCTYVIKADETEGGSTFSFVSLKKINHVAPIVIKTAQTTTTEYMSIDANTKLVEHYGTTTGSSLSNDNQYIYSYYSVGDINSSNNNSWCSFWFGEYDYRWYNGDGFDNMLYTGYVCNTQKNIKNEIENLVFGNQ